MDGGSGSGTPLVNPITKLNIRQRVEVAAWLFGVHLPIIDSREHRSGSDTTRRDLAIWFVNQRIGENLPTLEQLQRHIGATRTMICRSKKRLDKIWTDGRAIESLITQRILAPDRHPFSDSEVASLYRGLRPKETWPWRRGWVTGRQRRAR